MLLLGFNPLKIGSVCNLLRLLEEEQLASVSIPLKSGRFVIMILLLLEIVYLVSIPLKSGRFVMQWTRVLLCVGNRFNPLKIGSVCNP